MSHEDLARLIFQFLERTDHLACLGYTHDELDDSIVCACGETWRLIYLTHKGDRDA